MNLKNRPPVALTIAGSDPSGGAGLQADLKTFHQHGTYGMSVVTLLTVQNTQTVTAVRLMDAEFVSAQLDCVLADIPPHAAKVGALGSSELIQLVATKANAFTFPLVIDPVMISKHGLPLIDDAAVGSLRTSLLPRAYLATPNRFEAAAITGRRVESVNDFVEAAKALQDFGAQHVLIKGLVEDHQSRDLLWSNGEATWFTETKIDTRHTHGSGCVYAAAITAHLACGESLFRAVEQAKLFISKAIRTAPELGQGRGPVNMFAAVR